MIERILYFLLFIIVYKLIRFAVCMAVMPGYADSWFLETLKYRTPPCISEGIKEGGKP